MLDTVYLIASIHFWHLKTFILDKALQLMSVPSSQETISFNQISHGFHWEKGLIVGEK